MTLAQLHDPLRLWTNRLSGDPRLPASLVGGFVSAIALAVLSIAVLGDPFAGEPRLILRIDAPPAETASHDDHVAPAVEHAPPAASGHGAAEHTAPDHAATEEHAIAEPPHAAVTQAPAPAGETSRWGPVAALMENGPQGPLPRIGADGRTPLEAYARPFDRNDPRPRIAILVTGLGLSTRQTEAAIDTLPADVSLAFVPYAPSVQEWADLARYDGHETLLELPMEPFDFPDNDPGPYALLSDLSAAENAQRLSWLLSRLIAYPAIVTREGEDLLGNRPALMPIVDALAARGLGVLDSSVSPRSLLGGLGRDRGAAIATANTVIDAVPTTRAIDDQLADLERRARETGRAIGIASPLPATIERLTAWADDLASRGIALAPVSAMLEKSEMAATAPTPHDVHAETPQTRDHAPAPVRGHDAAEH